jgi:hypothetical protein
VLVAFTDPNALKSTGGGGSGELVPFTSPEDIMKNLPKVMSNMFGKGAGERDSSTFKITMKEYEDMAIKVGDKVRIEIKKANNSGVQILSRHVKNQVMYLHYKEKPLQEQYNQYHLSLFNNSKLIL